LIKKSLRLKAQLAAVKAQIQTPVHTVALGTNQSKPTASTDVDELGSGVAPWLVLSSGQSTYIEEVVSLKSVMPIALNLHYLSPKKEPLFAKGFFGINRTSSYEKHFSHKGKGVYHLSLPCGRVFAFTKQQDGSFIDEGHLGVEVKTIDANSFALHYYDGQKEYYSHGYLVGIKDSNDNTLMLKYAQGPKLISISNNFGASLQLSYDAKGLVSLVKDHGGREWTFTYDETETLVNIKHNKEPFVSYGYEKRMLAKREVNLLSHVYSASHTEKLALRYDEEARLASYTQAGVSYDYRYSDATHIQRTDAQGQSHSYTLDNMGFIASLGYPDGTMSVEKYDASSKTATIQTRGENLRVEVYDERDRLLSISINGKIERVYGYENHNPHPVSYIADAQTLYYSYDASYNLLSITYPDATSEHYSYNKQGQLTSHKDALGNTTTYTYNDKAELLSIEDPSAHKTLFTYDVLGRIITQEDAAGEIYSYSYNAQGQVENYTDPEGQSIAFSYTKEGLLQSLTDPARRKTTYSYDAHERLTQKRYPDGSKEVYTYCIKGLLQSIHRVDGTSVHFSYDHNKNITQVIAKDSEGNEEVMHYDYDALSNLLSATTKAHTIALQYNEKASITKETQNNLTLHKAYQDNQKQLQSLGFLGERVQYGYDASQNISSITHQNKQIKLSYNANHQPTKRSYPNTQKEALVYDENQNLIALQSHKKIKYSYDATSKLIEKTDTQSKESTTFTYTKSGALRQAGTQYFSYNKAGNQTQAGQTYNSLNQLIEDEERLYSYDKRGNLQGKLHKQSQERSYYVFNLFDQLIKVKRVDKDNALIEGFAYSYDALNRRVSKTTYTKETLPYGETHHYLYDEENIVAILDSNKALLASIVHDSNTDTPLSITTYNNPPKPFTKEETLLYKDLDEDSLAVIEKQRTQRTYYYHRDHQGSITALTDEAGNIVETFLYDEAYGTILAPQGHFVAGSGHHTQTVKTYNPYCYTGREFDSHDLYYYRARYYDPTVGRFISSDPIEFMAGDTNFYRYVGGDPVNYLDPSGLYSVSEFGYDAVKNIAGVCDSLTFGFTGYVGKKINAYRYGDQVANQVNEAIENSLGERGTDAAMIATGVGGWAKGGFKSGKMLWKNRKAIAGIFKAAQKTTKAGEKAAKCATESEKTVKKGLQVVDKAIEKLCMQIDKLKKAKAVNTNNLHYTQNSVNYTKESLSSLKDGVAKNKIPAGDVIKMPSGLNTSMDNRRLVVAKKLGKALKARVRNFDDALSWCARRRFKMKKGSTWGDAAKKRISNQKKSWRKNPIKAPDGLKSTPKIKIDGKVVDDI